MPEIERFNASQAPVSERMAYWSSVASRKLGRMLMKADPSTYKAELALVGTGVHSLVSVKSGPALLQRHSQGVDGQGEPPGYSLQIVRSGHCQISDGESAYSTAAGDIVLYTGAGEFDMRFFDYVHSHIIRVPVSRLVHRGCKFSPSGITVLSGRLAAARVIQSLTATAWDNLADRGGEELPTSLFPVVWDLLDQALGKAYPPEECSRADLVRAEAMAIIKTRFRDSDLKVGDIAAALDVSSRYLQKLFSDVGPSPSELIKAERLSFAASLLQQCDRRCSVTETAYDSGFGDLSHFSRAFARQFGVSPRAYRNAAAAAAISR